MLSVFPKISALDSKGRSVPYGQQATENNGHLIDYSRKPSVVATRAQATNLTYKCHNTPANFSASEVIIFSRIVAKKSISSDHYQGVQYRMPQYLSGPNRLSIGPTHGKTPTSRPVTGRELTSSPSLPENRS